MIVKNNNSRLRSKVKIRKTVSGTPERPRLSVYRSLNNIYAQLINDVDGTTILSVSSLDKNITDAVKEANGKTAKSKIVGMELAKLAAEKNITTCVFDRNGYRYHGRVKSFADGAREGGLKF